MNIAQGDADYDLLAQAVRLYDENKAGESLHIFLQLLNSHPTCWEAWVGYILASLDEGKTSDVMELLANIPSSQDSCGDIAKIYLLELCGRSDAAGDTIREAKCPVDLDQIKLALEAQWYSDIGDQYRAELLAQDILKTKITAPFVLLRISRIFAKGNNWINRRQIQKLIAAFDKQALVADPFGQNLLAISRLDFVVDPQNSFDIERKKYEINLVCRDYATNISVLIDAAQLLITSGELNRARLLLERILISRPSARIRGLLAFIAASEGNPKNEARLLLEELSYHPLAVSSYTNIANNMLARNLPQPAVEICENGINCCGRETNLLITLAQAANALNATQLVLELLDECAKRGNLAGSNLSTAAGLAIANEQLPLCEKILSLKRKGDIQAKVASSLYFIQSDRLKDAIQEAEIAFREEPTLVQSIPSEILMPLYASIKNDGKDFSPEMIKHIGVSLAYHQKLAEGFDFVQKAIELGDYSQDSFQHAIQMSLNLSNILLAKKYSTQALQAGCLTKETLGTILSVFASQNEIAQIRSLVDEFEHFENLPDDLMPVIAECYARILDDLPGGIRFLEKHFTATSSESFVDNFAQWLAEAGYFARSADVCRDAIEKYPNNAVLAGRLSLALERLGRASESLEYCKKSLESDPAFIWSLRKLDNHYQARFETANSSKLYENALVASPASVSIRKEYAKLLLNGFNNPSAAAEQIEHALLADPENAALRKRLEKYRLQAHDIEGSFGNDGIEWFYKHKEQLELISSRLRSLLGDRLLACCCLPKSEPKSRESEETGENDEKNKNSVEPRVLILLTDVPEDDTAQMASEIEERNRIIQDVFEQSGSFVKNHEDIHWSGFWRNCLDSNFELLRNIRSSFVLYDRGYLNWLRLLWTHREKALKKFEKYVAAYVVSGSFVRGDSRNDSDIDVWVVIDDTDVKKMTRGELEAKLRAILTSFALEAADELELENRLHIQTYILTNYWSSLRDAEPVIVSFLRDGRPLYDRGIFTAWRILFTEGRLVQQREVIFERLKKAHDISEKWNDNLNSLVEQALYAPILAAAQELLISYGIHPPEPAKTFDALMQLGVIQEEDAICVRDVVQLIYNRKHGNAKSEIGKLSDEISNKTDNFFSAVERAVKQAYLLGHGKDATKEDLLDQFHHWFKELDTVSEEKIYTGELVNKDLLENMVRKGFLDPGIQDAYLILLKITGTSQTTFPNVQERNFIEFARQQLLTLREKVIFLQKQQLRKNHLYFSYAQGSIGELFFCKDCIYVVHDATNLDNSPISSVSLLEDDYGTVNPSNFFKFLTDTREQTPQETTRHVFSLNETLLRSVHLAVGDEPTLNLTV